MILAYRHGQDIESLAAKTEINPGFTMDMIHRANYLAEQIKNRFKGSEYYPLTKKLLRIGICLPNVKYTQYKNKFYIFGA